MSPPLLLALLASTAGISAVDRIVAEIDAYAEAHPEQQRVFGCGDGSGEEATPWREYESDRAFFDQIASQTARFEMAEVAFRDGAVAVARMLVEAEHWALFTSSWYWPDGSLARIDSRLEDLRARVSVLQRRDYEANGALLRSSRRVLDQRTQKPSRHRESADVRVRPYRSASELPFSNLLR